MYLLFPDHSLLLPLVHMCITSFIGNIVGGSDNTVDPMTYDSQEFYSGCTNKEEPGV